MNNDTRPIGVFDSGVGGISVLAELVQLMPNEHFIYYGDSANAPYGTKSLDEVKELSFEIADKLIAMDCKALVIACNTATVAAVSSLRKKYSHLPVIGIEPALKPAVLNHPNSDILVMATHVTLNQNKFLNLLSRFEDQACIHTLECPGLVEFIERDKTDSPEFAVYLRVLLDDYRNTPPSAVVLGCTHYPFAKKQISEALYYIPAIYDGGNGTARETLNQLKKHNLIAPKDMKGSVEFINSNGDITLSQSLFNKMMEGK